MTLANGEQIIKDWDYATQKGGAGLAGKIKKTLTVTNKRIVHEVHSNVARTHQEIPLNSVKSISMSSVRKTSALAVLAIILGILVAIAGIVMGTSDDGTMAVMVPMLLCGVILVVIGIIGLGKGAFTLEIITKGMEGTPLCVGSSSIVSRRPKTKKIKMKVNLKVVDDIIDTLGAIILENAKD